VAKSRPAMLIIGWRNDEADHFTEISLLGWWAHLFSLERRGCVLGTVCMVPQLYATGGNRSYPGVLGRNQQPTVPRVNYPDSSPRALFERVARAGYSTMGGIGSHMVLWALSWDSAVRSWG
jgi:hypothetical protein